MLFNSAEFGIFLAVVLALYGGVRLAFGGASRATKVLLLVASYAFYASWNPAFVLLLAFSTVLDFTIGLRLEASERPALRRALVATSCAGNLGLLAFFKYGAFAWHSGGALACELAGAGCRLPTPAWLSVALPVGISFYTFQTLSYAIDVYRRDQRATRSWLDFAVYVSFFPQLVAGPIVRAGTFLPQVEALRSPCAREIEAGLSRIAIGLVKKVVFADGLGAFVDGVYADPSGANAASAAIAVYAYAFQIYFDFSGYTDIAIGTARLFGFALPENFDRPYQAASLREFWRRWHISLSTWLRDYLYISLGGNRKGAGRATASLFTTMLLGGLWHGAAWTFVLWGAYHGALLALERLARAAGLGARLPRWVGQLVTFHLVVAGFALFRAPDLASFGALCTALTRWQGLPSEPAAIHALLLLALVAAIHGLCGASTVRDRLGALPAWAQGVVWAGSLALVFVAAPAATRFIYFQF